MYLLPSSTHDLDDFDDIEDIVDNMTQLTPYVDGVQDVPTQPNQALAAPNHQQINHLCGNTTPPPLRSTAGTVTSSTTSTVSRMTPKADGHLMTDKDFARKVRGMLSDRNLSDSLIKAYRKISADIKRAKGNIQASSEALHMYAEKSPQWAMTVSYKDWADLNLKVAKSTMGMDNTDAASTAGQYEHMIRDLTTISPAYPVKDFWEIQKEIFKHTMTLSKATYVVWSERQKKDQLWKTAMDAVRNETDFAGL